MRARDKQQVAVEVSMAWTSPTAPRDVDALAIAEVPDVRGWLDTLDASGSEARLGLHGRSLTQLVAGEPVDIIEEAGDWVRIVAPWQPDPGDSRGYPGWVPRWHLEPRDGTPPVPAGQGVEPDPVAICEAAHRHLGLRYLWGGTTPDALDCSGLVHVSYRAAGLVVPRDAHAQYLAATRVPIGEERPGDLYFFARADGHVFHVGFVTGRGSMLHAPQTGERIEDAPLDPGRLETLLAAGRLPR